MQSHTMAPLHIHSKNFILLLTKNKQEELQNINSEVNYETLENLNSASSGFDEEEFDDDPQDFLNKKERLEQLEKIEESKINELSDILSETNINTKGNFSIEF